MLSHIQDWCRCYGSWDGCYNIFFQTSYSPTGNYAGDRTPTCCKPYLISKRITPLPMFPDILGCWLEKLKEWHISFWAHFSLGLIFSLLLRFNNLHLIIIFTYGYLQIYCWIYTVNYFGYSRPQTDTCHFIK